MKIYKIIFLIFLFPMLLCACSEDDDDFHDNESKGEGTLTIDGTTYDLSQGIIYNRERWEPEQGYNFDIDLVSSDFDISDMENPTGTGEVVALEMFCETTSDLGGGTYNFDPTETFPAGTFCGIIVTEMNATTEEGSVFYFITSGTVIVTKTSNVYEFTINVAADAYELFVEEPLGTEVPITAYYKGTLKKVDF